MNSTLSAIPDKMGETGRPFVIGLGVFDGVHLGHQKLLGTLGKMAGKYGAIALAMTFDPHPRTILHRVNSPELLYPVKERLKLLNYYGANETVCVPFTRELAMLPPAEFLQELLSVCGGRLCGICVGKNWHFGKDGTGSVAMLDDFCQANHLELAAIPEFMLDDEVVSSSAIRQAVANGMLEKASKMLGRDYALFGTVVHGIGYAGGSLGFPTANLQITDGIMMPDGVYAARVYLGNCKYRAAVNIGLAPTFQWSQVKSRRIEIHLLDFSGDLYGEKIQLEVLKYLRSERTFAGADELREQIKKDVCVIRSVEI